jgi:hypothetical protein
MDPSGASEAVCVVSALVPDKIVTSNLTNLELDQLFVDLERKRHGWWRIVTNFTLSWFAVTMGTGIVSILLDDLPYNANWL